jgi:hypothetical protein
MMKPIASIIFLKFFLFVPITAFATEPFQFMSSAISALERSYIAREHIQSKGTESLLRRMTDMQTFASDFRRAKAIIEPHTRSQTKIIKESAEAFLAVFSGFIENTNDVLSIFEHAQNNPRTFPEGTLNRKISAAMAETEQLWRDLMQATALSTYTLVNMDRTVNNKLAYLTITNTERNKLRVALRRAFGDKVTKGVKADLFPIEASGRLLWDFLHNNLRPADS